jgi:4-aminobutyrate aminotransferase
MSVSPSYTRSYPLVVKGAMGMTITDVDGYTYLDFTAGVAVTATGHCHPRVVEAITRQAQRLIHMSGTDFYYPSEIELAEKLKEMTPGRHDKRVFFTNSGSEATEASMKLARYHTKRPLYLSFYGGFHGRTMGALSLTGSKVIQRKGFSPLLPGVTQVPYAYCYRCVYGLTPDSCNFHCVQWIEEELFRTTVPPEEVAAIFVEPIQGEGGYVVPPPGYLKRLRELADRYGILLVADEIQSGMGRTGRMFAIDHEGVVPDIMTIAKGIASGLPLRAMVASADVTDWVKGSHANTFGGNPIACEAALTTIELLQEGLMQNAERMGTLLLEQLRKMMESHPLIGDVRGKGLMIGIELVKNRKTKEPAVSERDKVIQQCFEKGLLILGCGRSVLRLSPPLIVQEGEALSALEILEESLSEIEEGFLL